MDDGFVTFGTFCISVTSMGLLFFLGLHLGLTNNSKLEPVLQELNRSHPMVIDYMMEESPSHDMKEWFYTIATPDDL